MALPPARYFTLAEVAERWETTSDLILRHALDGLVEISMMVVGVGVQLGYDEEAVDGFYPVVESEEIVTGPQPLLLTDLWRILHGGTVAVRGFKPKVEDGFVTLLPSWSPQQISLRDLVITRAERDRVESEHDIEVQDACAGRPAAEPMASRAFTYSPDFRRVSLGQKTFRLGMRQAAVVRRLFEAAERGDPWVPAATLLSSANSRSGRLIDLFKTQAGWRDLIIGDGAGRYRLGGAARPRAFRKSRFAFSADNRSRSRDDGVFHTNRVG